MSTANLDVSDGEAVQQMVSQVEHDAGPVDLSSTTRR
jgi:NAD(P)-dependent dehydrogenase (short-subunit alcohol dehydrogenase family)